MRTTTASLVCLFALGCDSAHSGGTTTTTPIDATVSKSHDDTVEPPDDTAVAPDSDASDPIEDTTLVEVTEQPDTEQPDTEQPDTEPPDTETPDTTTATTVTAMPDTTSSDTTPEDPCKGLTYEGCCTADNQNVWCEDGALQHVDCDGIGPCGWVGGEIGYACDGAGSDPSGDFAKACPADIDQSDCTCGDADRCSTKCGNACPCGPSDTFTVKTVIIDHTYVQFTYDVTMSVWSDAPAGPTVCSLAEPTNVPSTASSALRVRFSTHIDGSFGCDVGADAMEVSYDRWDGAGHLIAREVPITAAAFTSWDGDGCEVELELLFQAGHPVTRTLYIAANPDEQCYAP